MMESKTIGGKIAEARKRNDLSQSQLAQHLFISAQAVGKWERGESLPDIITLERLARLLGVDLNYFSESFSPITTSEPAIDTVDQRSEENQPVVKGKKLNWDMSQGNWKDADFSGLKNLHTRFSGSNMQNCLFVGSDMSELLLKGNNVADCDFSGSDFSGSQIRTSHLKNNKFIGCTMKGAVLSASHVTACDFSGSDFTGVSMQSGGFEKNNMQGVRLLNVSFRSSYIAGILFEGRIENCSFENCRFSKVTMQNATLINTFFKGLNLKRLRLINCRADRLTYAFLKNAGADLREVTLYEE